MAWVRERQKGGKYKENMRTRESGRERERDWSRKRERGKRKRGKRERGKRE
jgi:hypothetical protein